MIDVGCAGYMPYPWDINNYGKYINFILSFDILDGELQYLKESFKNYKKTKILSRNINKTKNPPQFSSSY